MFIPFRIYKMHVSDPSYQWKNHCIMLGIYLMAHSYSRTQNKGGGERERETV